MFKKMSNYINRTYVLIIISPSPIPVVPEKILYDISMRIINYRQSLGMSVPRDFI